MQVFWFIPTHGDSRYLGTAEGARQVDHTYLQQVAVAADTLGYEGVLIPTGRSCEDPWVVAASLIPVTKRLRFLVAVRPGLMAPTLAARMAATYDRLSNGRLLVNLVTGGDPAELAGDGLFLDHAQRYEASEEFIRIWRETLAASHEGAALDYTGKHLSVKGAKVLYPPVQRPHPPVYFGGSSEAAHELAAEQVDTYLTWGEPPAAVAEKIADVRARAAKHGRTVRFGIRLHVIVRETEDEAWAAADKLISKLDDTPWPVRKRLSARWIRPASNAWPRCMPTASSARAPIWRSARTCGPAWVWCAVVPARRWWAIRKPWPRA